MSYRDDDLEMWLTVGLSVAQEKIVVIGVSTSKWKAQAAGIERNTGPEKCERWEVFRVDDQMGPKLNAWFLEGGMAKQDAADSVRELAKSLGQKMQSTMRRSAPGKKRRKRK